MTTRKLVILGLLSSFSFVACKDNLIECADSNTEPVLVFGHFFGECFGESCVETFKLTDTQLFEDKVDNYGGAGDSFDFEELSADLFEQVAFLRAAMPQELLALEDQTFGCPDCGDQGGVYISWTSGGVTQSWLLDAGPIDGEDALTEFASIILDTIRVVING